MAGEVKILVAGEVGYCTGGWRGQIPDGWRGWGTGGVAGEVGSWWLEKKRFFLEEIQRLR
jgi:hypothetical protein